MFIEIFRKRKGRILFFLFLVIYATVIQAEPQADTAGDIMSGEVGALGALTHAQVYEAQRAGSSNVEFKSNGDARPIEPGATLVLMEESGPGMVTHFWNTVGSLDPFYARSLVLRIYYDGLEQPSVEVPLGDFFGVGHGAERQFTSIPVVTSSNGRSRVSYWQMPFGKSIKITVTNEHPDIRVDSFYYYLNWHKMDALSEDTLYLHARYRQETPAQPGNYKILETRGRGHYVGTVLSVLQMETGWFGEGDDFFYIDGATEPQLRGTGTEDYFNDSWGFREFSTPYHGVPLYEGIFAGDRVSAYRWHIVDPVPFNESLHVEIEHRGSIFDETAPLPSIEVGGFIERYDWVSSVAFWYQYPPAVSEAPFPAVSERVPPCTFLLAAEMPVRADPPLLIAPMEPAIIYLPGIRTGKLEFDFEVEADGRYRLDGVFMFSLMSGVYQPYLNDVPIGGGPVDFGAKGMDPVWISLDIHNLKAGTQTIKFAGVDQPSKFRRNLSPAQDGIGVVGFKITRLDTLDGYQKALKQIREKQAQEEQAQEEQAKEQP